MRLVKRMRVREKNEDGRELYKVAQHGEAGELQDALKSRSAHAPDLSRPEPHCDGCQKAAAVQILSICHVKHQPVSI